MSDQNLRYQLDGPMRKVRADLGLPPLDLLQDTIRDNSMPLCVLEHPGNLTAETVEALRGEWRARMSGPRVGHRLPILDYGFRVGQ